MAETKLGQRETEIGRRQGWGGKDGGGKRGKNWGGEPGQGKQMGEGRQLREGKHMGEGNQWDRERDVGGVPFPHPKVLGKKPEA